MDTFVEQQGDQIGVLEIGVQQDNGIDEDTLYAVGAEDPYLGEAVNDLQGEKYKDEDSDNWDEDPYSSDDDEWN